MASELPPEQQVPFRWPAAWTNPQLISVLAGGPVNCLLTSGTPSAAIAEPARKAGFFVGSWEALSPSPIYGVKWRSPAPIVALTEVVWPRLKPVARGGGNQAITGPTGAPWIDSTSWAAKLAASRGQGKQIWLGFEPPQDLAPDEAAYRLAIADCAAAGARWPVALDAKLSAGLAAGNGEALKTWRAMADTLSFFEKHRAWRLYRPDGPLGIISTFSGTNEFMGTEVLNLAARRNLLYRIIDQSVANSADLSGLRAVLCLDPERPTDSLISKLAGFARDGGLVIVPPSIAPAFRAQQLLDCPVAGYELRALGKGSVACPSRRWEDPYWLALEVHSLVSRRYDPVRMFNASSLWVHYSLPPRGSGSLIQLVNFTGRPIGSVSLRIQVPHRSVAIHILESAGPAPLAPVQVDGNVEYQLPSFTTYAALEVNA